MDLNIVPATFVKKTLDNIRFDVQDDRTNQITGELKCEKPIEVLFEGADTNIYRPTKHFSKELVSEMITNDLELAGKGLIARNEA